MITARAGKDLVSSLCAGLLTIGPRFGGAVNEGAANWLKGVQKGISANTFVEEAAAARVRIAGIGHKKYSIRNPDPRVEEVVKFAQKLGAKKHLTFARSIEKITTAKKANLILNVDGAIAAVLLDILSEREGYSEAELEELVRIEFFNSYFVLARSIGFTAHYLDQRRLDEGLFRLPHNLVADKS
jgi:citrate synthase